MFGGGNKKAAIEQVETIVGKETCVKGTITTKGAVRIDGQFEGEIQSLGDLLVGETGAVRAQIKARSGTIAGTINGNLDIAEKLELLPTARVYGDIKVGTLIISEGAVFKGGCEMRRAGEEAAATKAK
ncbi:bactofilin family protein [Sporolituus thermophilus]|uniref:Protein CcmA, bactofilin family n=1 Tax=Sporolituus thermophilus DSM 23256 TaxID=1123285 RepID=A0A1G7L2G8_9FIRM|nr:polymer-forming cytoskeletal protein [Sporolituus thermophilus]SDF43742.1 protein CcmA, bactofilin family [Sporolituus thermophilus DSM 23256]